MAEESDRPTEVEDLDRELDKLRARAAQFRGLTPGARARLLRASLRTVVEVAPEWVRAGHRAKDLPASAGEEWLAGPVPLVRYLRLLAETWERLADGGPPLDAHRVRTVESGRVEVDVAPTSWLEPPPFWALRAVQRMAPGATERSVLEEAGRVHHQPGPPEVAAVLGAGTSSSLAARDALHQLFSEGRVAVLKMSPVNEWAGPFLERALTPLVTAGYLAVAYGGPEEGRHLAAHAGVDAVHLTGSEETFASLRGEVSHPFTGALGGVGPVVVVPGTYARSELDAMAWTVAGMLTDNAGFNCYAASVLLLAEWWPQRRAFLDRLDAALSRVPTRLAYHPGALARHAALTEGKRFRSLGERSLTRLPWTVIEDLDPDADERLYRMAPFCGLLGVVSLAVGEPEAFLHSATRFAEERLKGSLAATLFVSGPFERSASGAQALDAAIDGLTYGTVAVNTSPSSAHALMAPAWGPHASHEGSQSQVWTHNTHLLEGIEKTVLRGPLNLAPRPRWPAGCPPYELGCRLLDMEASPSVRQLPGLTWATLGADFRTSGW